ncbi:MAG: hypothetical protein CL699_06835 [Chloroflexi bacterium]|nr:hypothetical protein [Chloroflexota bacterium]
MLTLGNALTPGGLSLSSHGNEPFSEREELKVPEQPGLLTSRPQGKGQPCDPSLLYRAELGLGGWESPEAARLTGPGQLKAERGPCVNPSGQKSATFFLAPNLQGRNRPPGCQQTPSPVTLPILPGD